MLDIYRGTEATDIFGDIIAEYYATHGRFARSRLAHQEDLLLLRFLKIVHAGGFPRLSSNGMVASVVWEYGEWGEVEISAGKRRRVLRGYGVS